MGDVESSRLGSRKYEGIGPKFLDLGQLELSDLSRALRCSSLRGRVWRASRVLSTFRIAVLFQINSLAVRQSYKGKQDQMREAPMTTGAQALLFAGEFICLLFAAIVMMYFADRLRSDVLKSLDEPSKRHHFREQR